MILCRLSSWDFYFSYVQVWGDIFAPFRPIIWTLTIICISHQDGWNPFQTYLSNSFMPSVLTCLAEISCHSDLSLLLTKRLLVLSRSFAKSLFFFLFTIHMFHRNCRGKKSNHFLSGGLNHQVALFLAELYPEATTLGIQGFISLPPFLYMLFFFLEDELS